MSQIQGRLSCTVIKGTDLFPKAAGGTSHPYCTVTLPESSEQTEVKQKTLNPIWDQFFTFNIYQPFCSVEFTVHDNETGDFIGKASLDLVELADQNPHENQLELQAREMQDEVSGHIHVSLQYKYTSDWDSLYGGVKLAENGEYEKSIEPLSKALEKMPMEIKLYEARSIAYLNTNQLKLALNDAVKIRDINPNITTGHFRIGNVYQAAGKIEEAKKAYNAGLTYNSKDPNILEAIANLLHPKLNTKPQQIDDTRRESSRAEELYNDGEYRRALNEINGEIKKDQRSGSLYLARIVILIALTKTTKDQSINKADLVKLINADSIMVGQLLPRWAKDNSEKMGYMKKGGEYNRFKKRRWFVLTKGLLLYYNSKDDTEPNGSIPINLGPIRKVAKDKFTIQVPGRVYELTEKNSVDSWISAIKNVAQTPLEFPEIKFNSSSLSRTPSYRLSVMNIIKESTQKVVMHGRKNIIREGILYKSGRVRKAWKKRYFILKPQELYYFEDEPEEKNPTALGVINLIDSVWKKADGDSFAQHMFQVCTSNRIYNMYAVSRDDMYEWKAAIELCSQREFNPSALSIKEEIGSPQNLATSPVAKTPTSNIEETPEPKEDLPDLADVAASDDITLTEVIEDDAEEEQNDFTLSGSYTGISLLGGEMTSSESRYFKKFGLTPPEQINKRNSVRLITSNPQILPVASSPKASASVQDYSSIQKVPYTSVGVQPSQPTNQPKTEKDPLLPKANPQTKPTNNQQQQQRRRRPPPPQEDTCSCNIL